MSIHEAYHARGRDILNCRSVHHSSHQKTIIIEAVGKGFLLKTEKSLIPYYLFLELQRKEFSDRRIYTLQDV